jgi:hypothetical protein
MQELGLTVELSQKRVTSNISALKIHQCFNSESTIYEFAYRKHDAFQKQNHWQHNNLHELYYGNTMPLATLRSVIINETKYAVHEHDAFDKYKIILLVLLRGMIFQHSKVR